MRPTAPRAWLNHGLDESAYVLAPGPAKEWMANFNARLAKQHIGNVHAGFMADAWRVSTAIWAGGLVCLAGVVATGFALPRFYAYRSAVGGGPY